MSSSIVYQSRTIRHLVEYYRTTLSSIQDRDQLVQHVAQVFSDCIRSDNPLSLIAFSKDKQLLQLSLDVACELRNIGYIDYLFKNTIVPKECLYHSVKYLLDQSEEDDKLHAQIQILFRFIEHKAEIPRSIIDRALIIATKLKHREYIHSLCQLGDIDQYALYWAIKLCIEKDYLELLDVFLFHSQMVSLELILGEAAESNKFHIFQSILSKVPLTPEAMNLAIHAAICYAGVPYLQEVLNTFEIPFELKQSAIQLIMDRAKFELLGELLYHNDALDQELFNYAIEQLIDNMCLVGIKTIVTLKFMNESLLESIFVLIVSRPNSLDMLQIFLEVCPSAKIKKRAEAYFTQRALIESFKPLAIPASLRVHLELPHLEPVHQAKLQHIIELINRLDFSQEKVHGAAQLAHEIETSLVGRLLERLLVIPLSQEAFTALEANQKGELMKQYRSSGMHPKCCRYFLYHHYQKCCQERNARYQKLVDGLVNHFKRGLRSEIATLGMPSPLSDPCRLKEWIQQLVVQLTYLENHLQTKITDPKETESVIFELLESLENCSSALQAGVNSIYDRLITGVMSNPMISVIMEGLQTAYADAEIATLTLSQGDVHQHNEILRILSQFRFQKPIVGDALCSLDEQKVLSEFYSHYRFSKALHAIKVKLDQATPFLKKTFLESIPPEKRMIKDEELRLIEETVDLLDHSKDLERHEEALLLKLQRWIDQPQLEGTRAVYLLPEEAKFLEAYLSSEVFQNFKETVCFDVSQIVELEIARIAKGENLTAEEAIIYSEYMASASARSLKDFIHSRENFSDILKKAIEKRKPDFQMSVLRKAQQERTETLFKVQAQKGSLRDFVKSQGQSLIKKISSDEVVQRRFDELAELRHPFHHDGTIKESAIIQWLLQNSLIQGPEITDHVLAQLAAKD